MKCRHSDNGCSAVAVAYVDVPIGCVAFPNDKKQWLCGQHVLTGFDGVSDLLILKFDDWVDEETRKHLVG